ncbi:hypothetical protein [Flavisolibacter tropicus]|uniref:Uncharacterized protein n=1 Tax=Flavisolibacter tropicus TaxID=1492898 RepID=A0A172TY34_9BACT|nr:hypothetical protein [Flavisolibacter tropicus]ANE51878.1 hypothetical protein SY85_16645 [Flavisolibacter tropicus]
MTVDRGQMAADSTLLSSVNYQPSTAIKLAFTLVFFNATINPKQVQPKQLALLKSEIPKSAISHCPFISKFVVNV